jgi:hypothetical protein
MLNGSSSPHVRILQMRSTCVAKLDADSARAYRRMCGIVMLATCFTPPPICRKGRSVSTLFLNALMDASEKREVRWRLFVTTTASLNRDLEDSGPVAINSIRRARDELIRIVVENADLL